MISNKPLSARILAHLVLYIANGNKTQRNLHQNTNDRKRFVENYRLQCANYLLYACGGDETLA